MYNVRRALSSDSFVFFSFFALSCTSLWNTVNFLWSTPSLLEPQPFFLLQLQRLEWLQSHSHLLIAKSKCNAQCCRFQLGTVPEMHSQMLSISLVEMHSGCLSAYTSSDCQMHSHCLMPEMLTLSSVTNVNGENCQMHCTAGCWMVVWGFRLDALTIFQHGVCAGKTSGANWCCQHVLIH